MHIFINQIKPGQTIDGIYMASDPILRSTTKGDLYLAMYISDKTGQLNSRMWQASEAVYNSLPNPGFVHIQARSELYRENLQIVINNVRPVDPDQVSIEDFLPRTEKDTDLLFKEIVEMLQPIKNDHIRALVRLFLADKKLMENFRLAPAAVKMHHNYLGGLVEHTHGMLKVATAILPLYPHVQPDLVLAGIFLHDIGKTEELSYDMAFSYTDSGQLIGHIAKSLVMINQKADALAAEGNPVDQHVLDALGHIMLAHHGQYEFGSPKLPATCEAFMVNYIDDLDAKMNQISGIIDQEQGDSNWTTWQRSLETRIYRRRLD